MSSYPDGPSPGHEIYGPGLLDPASHMVYVPSKLCNDILTIQLARQLGPSISYGQACRAIKASHSRVCAEFSFLIQELSTFFPFRTLDARITSPTINYRVAIRIMYKWIRSFIELPPSHNAVRPPLLIGSFVTLAASTLCRTLCHGGLSFRIVPLSFTLPLFHIFP